MKGFVLSARSGHYRVLLEDGTEVECSLRGKNRMRGEAGAVISGDLVEMANEGDGVVIKKALPRSNCIERSLDACRMKPQGVVANVDMALVVFAANRPRPRVDGMDRYLVSVEYQKVNPVIVFNKWDLADDESHEVLELYQKAGYICLCFSALLEPEKARTEVLKLDFKRLYVCGPSGVGKTSILNATLPHDLSLVGEVSHTTGRGRHTTTATCFKAAGPDRFIADTPGVGQLMLYDMPYRNLKNLYREFVPLAKECKYRDCLHLEEPDCKVREKVEDGTLSCVRLESYRLFLEELRRENKMLTDKGGFKR